jgi:hypothetical protein
MEPRVVTTQVIETQLVTRQQQVDTEIEIDGKMRKLKLTVPMIESAPTYRPVQTVEPPSLRDKIQAGFIIAVGGIFVLWCVIVLGTCARMMWKRKGGPTELVKRWTENLISAVIGVLFGYFGMEQSHENPRINVAPAHHMPAAAPMPKTNHALPEAPDIAPRPFLPRPPGDVKSK